MMFLGAAKSVSKIEKYLKFGCRTAKTRHGGQVSGALALIWPEGPGKALVQYIDRYTNYILHYILYG